MIVWSPIYWWGSQSNNCMQPHSINTQTQFSLDATYKLNMLCYSFIWWVQHSHVCLVANFKPGRQLKFVKTVHMFFLTDLCRISVSFTSLVNNVFLWLFCTACVPFGQPCKWYVSFGQLANNVLLLASLQTICSSWPPCRQCIYYWPPCRVAVGQSCR